MGANSNKVDHHVCQEPGCTMPAMHPYAACPKHLLWGTRCIVPGCERDRLLYGVTCWKHWLADARLDERDDTPAVTAENWSEAGWDEEPARA